MHGSFHHQQDLKKYDRQRKQNAERILYTKSYNNSNKQKEFGTIALVYREKKTAVE